MPLSTWQASFNGLTVGPGTGYDLVSVDGIDSWDVRTNDALLPNLWGVQAGGDFVNARSVILGVQMASSLGTASTLEAAFVPPSQTSPSTLLPLVFKLSDRPELQVMCRVRKRARTRTPETEASYARWLIQLDAPDPRLYSSTLSTLVMTAFVSDNSAIDLTAGSGADLATDLTTGSGADLATDFTGTGSSGTVNVVNAGDVDTYPAFTFTTISTLASWQLINDTTGETASFVFALTVGSGHSVVADMAAVATGSTATPIVSNGSSNYAAWQAPRVPLRLAPGTNTLRFVVLSGTQADASCSVAWRSAYL